MIFDFKKKWQLSQCWKAVAAISIIAVAGCGSHPPVPDWALTTEASAQRATSAYLQGQTRIEVQQWQKAREAVASTAQPALAARIELMRCAVQVVSLDWSDCPDYEALAKDAAREDQAYARYLQAKPQEQDIELLPVAQRAVARLLRSNAATEPVLPEIVDPLSRMVAASVLLRAGKGSPALLQQGVDTASQQGWRRPLMAWLLLQLQAAQHSGNAEQLAQVQRRLKLLDASLPR